MKNEDGHTIIGCEECDMRINPEANENIRRKD